MGHRVQHQDYIRYSFLGLIVLFFTSSKAVASPGPPPPRYASVVQALAPKTNTVLWELRTTEPAYYEFFALRGKLILFSVDRQLGLALDPKTGSILWRVALREKTAQEVLWSQRVFDGFEVEEVPESKALLFDGQALIHESTGALLRQAESKGGMFLHHGLLLEGSDCDDNQSCSKVSRIAPSTGKTLWTIDASIHQTRSWLQQTNLLLLAKNALLDLSKGVLYDPRDGKKIWQLALPGGLDGERLDSFDQSAAAPIIRESVLMKGEARRGVISTEGARNTLYAVDIKSGQVLWKHPLRSPYYGRDCGKKCQSGSVRQYSFVDIGTGFAFYDGFHVVLISRDGKKAPTILWPAENDPIADGIEVSAIYPVAGGSTVIAVEDVQSQEKWLVGLRSNGAFAWTSRQRSAQLEAVALRHNILAVTMKAYSGSIPEDLLKEEAILRINALSGENLSTHSGYSGKQVYRGPLPAAEHVPIFHRGEFFEEAQLDLERGEIRPLEKNALPKPTNNLSLRSSRTRSSSLDFDTAEIAPGSPVDEADIAWHRQLSLGAHLIRFGVVKSSADLPYLPPKDIGLLRRRLKQASGGEFVTAIEGISQFPAETSELVALAESAIMEGRCKNYGCLDSLSELQAPEAHRLVLRLLAAADEDQKSERVSVPGYATQSFLEWGEPEREQLADLAMQSLAHAPAVPSQFGAQILVLLDLPRTKDALLAYRDRMIGVLSTGDSKQIAQIDWRFRALGPCALPAWNALVETALREFSNKRQVDYSILSLLEELAPYTGEVEAKRFFQFFDYIVEPPKGEPASLQSTESFLGYAAPVLGKLSEKRGEPRLVAMLLDPKLAQRVTDVLSYSPPPLSLGSIRELFAGGSPTVQCIAAKAALAAAEKSEIFSEPLDEALLKNVLRTLNGKKCDNGNEVYAILSERPELLFPAYAELLGSEPADVIIRLLKRLYSMKSKRELVQPAIIELSKHPLLAVRSAAQSQLTSISIPERPRVKMRRYRPEFGPMPKICQ